MPCNNSHRPAGPLEEEPIIYSSARGLGVSHNIGYRIRRDNLVKHVILPRRLTLSSPTSCKDPTRMKWLIVPETWVRQHAPQYRKKSTGARHRLYLARSPMNSRRATSQEFLKKWVPDGLYRGISEVEGRKGKTSQASEDPKISPR